MLGTNRAIPKFSQQPNYNNWKHLGFLLQEIYNVIIHMFSNPSSAAAAAKSLQSCPTLCDPIDGSRTGPPFVWPGTNRNWISQSRWLAPNGTYWICGSYLWSRLPPGWIGRCILGLAFTHGFVFSEIPEKPANLLHHKTRWARSVFHRYDYLATVFVPSLGTADVML